MLPQRIFKAHRSAGTVGGNASIATRGSLLPLVRSRSPRSMTDTIETAQPQRHLERFRRRAHAEDACGTHVRARARATQDKGLEELPRELKFIEHRW